MKWLWIAGALGAAVVLRELGATPGTAPSPGPTPSPGPVPDPTPTPDPHIPNAPFPQIATGKVRVIGDSLGVGLAPPLRTILGSVDGSAIGGTRIDTWVAWGAHKNIGGNAPLVLVSLGTNDIASNVKADAIRRDVPHLVHQIRNGGSKVAWIGPPILPWPGADLRAALAADLAAMGVPLFDSTALAFERSADRIHATPAGYKTWAAAIAVWLKSKGLL